MRGMANRAYASIWAADFTEETLVERWRQFLETVPFSKERRGFTELVIRAVDTTETPIVEQDLRSGEFGADVLAEIAQEHAHNDCSYEAQAYWDLWTYDDASASWAQKPQPLGIICYGADFDDGAWKNRAIFWWMSASNIFSLATQDCSAFGGGMGRRPRIHPAIRMKRVL